MEARKPEHTNKSKHYGNNYEESWFRASDSDRGKP